ncbi:MAG: hypothetical protein V5B60_21490 [Accumulibacter sp.]|jgi:cellulose biosynthesis protein BcsQ|uniref:KGGVGR-motif variant AAA ATPase n=1 Tax=Accumulibacter sp. TaxID=2053492 RepID=UPI002FC3BEC3
MSTTVRCFDQALPAVLELLSEQFAPLAEKARPETTIVRDAFGGLFVVLPDDALADTAAWQALAARLHATLGRYSPGERRVLLAVGDLIDANDVLASADRVSLPDAPNTCLVDRLQTNQDWLRNPLGARPPLPTAVAFSIKGGVGRTTACALWAWFLAREGRDVVVVDLDIESPGLAGVLLGDEWLPDYGLVDWLVESLRAPPDELLLHEYLSNCALAHDAPGRIRVLPAYGKKTRDYINKLGRVYMPSASADGAVLLGIAERLWQLLEQLARLPEPPDAVLLDSRAGLHDISSAVMTRLAAQVFLFARDDPASWQAYGLLFDHLRQARSVQWGMPDDDLRWRLTMVVAQADIAENTRQRARMRCYETWQPLYDDENYDSDESDEQGVATGAAAHSSACVDDRMAHDEQRVARVLAPLDEDGPHWPLFIAFDPRLRTIDLADAAARPDWQTIAPTFAAFFAAATERLLPASEPDGAA